MSYLQKVKEWEIKSGYRSEEADPYKTLFDKATAKLNKDYPADVLPFIKKKHSKLNDAINTSERKLDQLWDKAAVEEFRDELITFYKLNREAVNLYREEQT